MKETLHELLKEPRYGLAETARLVGMGQTRVRRWLKGYSYTWDVDGQKRHGRQDPIVKDTILGAKQGASFLDLIELLFASSFVDNGIPLQRVRAALEEARKLFQVEYPFASRRFFTDGSEIYFQIEKESSEHLLQLFSGGQWVFPQVIHAVAKQITFDSETELPLDWWPNGKDGGVLISPRISFGAPSLANRYIKTGNIFDLYNAEKQNPEAVARWYGISEAAVLEAVVFERQLLVA